ncbi:MAG: GNAT family N-acetyltransferase [Anaerolineales bacterium]
MSDLTVMPVVSASDRDQFLSFPYQLYQDDPLWVPPVLSDTEERIDPQRGTFFERGEAAFFLALRRGEVVGRICAADDRLANLSQTQGNCLFGFFETIDDLQVAQAMLKSVAHWAERRGLEILTGPYDLDYEDSYGVLVQGWDRPPAILCGHSPTYYKRLFEAMEFTPLRGDALAYEIQLQTDSPSLERLLRLGQYVAKRARVRVRPANMKDFEGEVDRVLYLLNHALTHLPGFVPWQREVLHKTFETFRAFADPELILFAEVDGRTVGWLPGVPNVNEALIHANGLRRPWDYLRLWWHMRRQPACLAVKSVLVLREYWDQGVPALLFAEMARRAGDRGYQWADLSLTAADNPTTPTLAQRMGARIYKRYRVYQRPIKAVLSESGPLGEPNGQS